MEPMTNFSKREISLRYWLQGREFYRALEAMDWAMEYHTGVRKDGVTPEFDHQISIAHYARTLPCLRNTEDTLITVMLHDLREDYNVSDEEVMQRFGPTVALAVEAMTKTFRGVKGNEAEVFAKIAANPIASIAKGADRVHNLDSMIGVFTPVKQAQYVDETVNLFLPMLKIARRRFPDQEPAYENIKHMLNSQIKLITEIHTNTDLNKGTK